MHTRSRTLSPDDSDYEAASSSLVNNDWMTHHPGWLSNTHQLQQPHNLAQWVQDRQRAFAEFSSSLTAPNRSNFFQESPLDAFDPWHHHNRNSRSVQQQVAPSSDNKKMLQSTGTEATLSPKAKVSYDEGEFMVEIPLPDYRVRHFFYHEKMHCGFFLKILLFASKHEKFI